MNALRRQFKEEVLAGRPRDGADQRVLPDQGWADAGYQAPVVYAFCREAGDRFRPAVGRGAAQHARQQAGYSRPTTTGSVVRLIGEAYHASWLPAEQLLLLEADADPGKTRVHRRLATPVGSPGSLTFHAAPHPQQEHLALAKHLTAEHKVEEFVTGKGVAVRWERLRKQNHGLHATYHACCAGHGCGVRLVQEQVPEPPPAPRTVARPNELAGHPWAPNRYGGERPRPDGYGGPRYRRW
jgi:hypothetical protein